MRVIMESEGWCNDEPEAGQVAWLKNDPPFGPAVCFISDRGKAWRFAHGVKRICDPSCPPWQPITTPEEERLRKRVEELIKAIEKHRDSISCLMDYCDNEANKELWANLPAAGGG